MNLVLFILFSFVFGHGDPLDMNTEFVQKLNGLRVEGCHCGRSTIVVEYHPLLEKSATRYAERIYRDNHFEHVDKRGWTVGNRVDQVGYRWLKVGENLGRNQFNIDQLLQDWLKSPTHCKLLMNPALNEVGLGRYKNIWVLHMGRR